MCSAPPRAVDERNDNGTENQDEERRRARQSAEYRIVHPQLLQNLAAVRLLAVSTVPPCDATSTTDRVPAGHTALP